MLKANYDVLVRNGTERFIIIPEKDFQAMQERLEDDADFRAIESSKKRQAKSRRYGLNEMKRELASLGRRRKSQRKSP